MQPEPPVQPEQPQAEVLELPTRPTAPVLTGGAQLRDYRGVEGRRLKKIRWNVTSLRWHPEARDTRVDRRFWTLVQASLYESYRQAGMGLFRHAVLCIPKMSLVVQRNIQQYFSHIPGLEYLLEHTHVYVEEWVRVFYATLYIEQDREYIQFMFAGRPLRLYRQTVAQLLGVPLYERRLHTDVYGQSDPPRSALGGGQPLSRDEVAVCFREGFTARVPSQLTPEAYVVHLALRQSLLPRVSYREGITTLQQHLLRAMMTRTPNVDGEVRLCVRLEVIPGGKGTRRGYP